MAKSCLELPPVAVDAKRPSRGKEEIIPLNKIEFMNDAYPREKVLEERIEEFVELYKNGAEISPIILARIPAKGNGGERHILIDGRHRFLAAEKSNVRSLQAIIYNDIFPKVDLTSIATVTLRKNILYYSALLNWFHGSPLKSSEKIDNIRNLFRMGVTIEELIEAKFGVRSTIYKYVRDILEDQNKQKEKEKEEQKKKCIELAKEGLSKKEISQRLDIPRTTVRVWLDEVATSLHSDAPPPPPSGNGNDLDLKENTENLEPTDNGKDPDFKTKYGELEEPKKTGKRKEPTLKGKKGKTGGSKNPEAEIQRQREKEYKKSVWAINKLVKSLDGITFTDEVDSYFVDNMISTCKKISKKFRKIVRDKTTAGTIMRLELEKKKILDSSQNITDKLRKLEKDKALLEKKLAKKTACNKNCKILQESTHKQFIMMLKGRVSDAQELIAAFYKGSYDISKGLEKALRVVSSTCEWGFQMTKIKKEDFKIVEPLKNNVEKLRKEVKIKDERVIAGLNRLGEIGKFFK